MAMEQMAEVAAAAELGPGPVTVLSWDPRIILVKRFLSLNESAHIISLASASMARSSVVSASGAGAIDEIRTSTGTFLAPSATPTLDAIERRVATLTMLPLENQEALQILHYAPGQKYGAHMDTFQDSREKAANAPGKQRAATALMFLNTPEEGGETAFPNIEAHNDDSFSPCARESLAHKPETGDLILFWSQDADGEVNIGATHTACPVIRGEKWSAPLWIHEANFQHPGAGKSAEVAPGGCGDLSKGCRAWMLGGECERNPGFMSGPGGQCRASCKDCPES